MNAYINSAGHVIVNGRDTDLLVRTASGYEICRRLDGVPVAGKLQHLIGKRIVLKPKKASQITEADFLAEVAKAAA